MECLTEGSLLGRREVSGYSEIVPRTSNCKLGFRYVPNHLFMLVSLMVYFSINHSYTNNIDGPQADDLLKPVFMGCATKNAKVVAISLGSLQRLIALKAVPQSAVPLIINTMSDCMNQGVDIQLRILQTLLSLITNFPAIHGDLLGEVCIVYLLIRGVGISDADVRFRLCYYASNFKSLVLQSCHRQLQLLYDNWSCLFLTR